MFMELAQLSVRNLLRARARLLMTAGGVLVGTAAVILLVAITFGLQQAAEQGIGASGALTEIQVYPGFQMGPGQQEIEPPALTQAVVNQFWRIPGVQLVIPILNYRSWGELRADDLRGGGQIIGIDPQLLPYLSFEVSQGELALNPGQVLMGAQLPLNFFDPEATEYMPSEVDVMTTPIEMALFNNTGTDTQEIDLNIAGVLAPNPAFDYSLIMPISEVIELNDWLNGEPIPVEDFRYDMVIIRTTSRETTTQVSEAIKEMGFTAGGMGEFINQLNSFFTTMRLMLGALGGVALLVAAFGVANTMTMAILERTREIGLMKAVGATDRDVLTVFLIEAGLVGLFGGVAGVAIALVVQNTVNEALRSMPAPDPNMGGGGGFFFLPVDMSQLQNGLIIIPPELTLFALALATGVGVAAGLFPALRAARMTPLLALKTD